MSTAQALLAALPSTPLSRAGDPRNTDDGSSFKDALDSASRSNDTATQDKEAKVSRPKRAAEKPSSHDEDANVERDADETESEEPTARRTDQTSTAWAALLAALNGGSSDGNGNLDFAAALKRARAQGLTGPAVGTLGSGAMDAGLVGDDGETVDAAALLALLKSEANASLEAGGIPTVDAGATSLDGMVIEEIKTTVIAQETHLALEPAPSEIMARLMEQGQGAESADAETTQSKPAGVNNQAAAKIAAGDVLEGRNQQPAAHPHDNRPQTGSSQSGGWQEVASTDTTGAGSARGAQSGSGQQSQSNGQGNGQGSAVFAALVDGGLRGAAAASGVGDGFESYAPVGDQIAAQVRAEIGADGLGKRSSDGVVKVLQIELKPANLGSVTVRIALKDNAVTLHLEAQRHETLAAIERDRDALAGALSSAGYTVDGITAAPQGDGARSNTAFAAGASDASAAGQQNAGQSLANSSSGQRESGQPASQGSAYGSQSTGKDEGTNAARRDADGLYV